MPGAVHINARRKQRRKMAEPERAGRLAGYKRGRP